MSTLKTKAANIFPSREAGQGMVEYGLIIALVAVVAIAGLIILGPRLSTIFSQLGSSV
jgi:pilus assembly protein Flp/PilA